MTCTVIAPSSSHVIPLKSCTILPFSVQAQGKELPFYSAKVPAGFPSPGDDHLESNIDLNKYLVSHPASTFFVRAYGDAMIEAGVYHGDVLIVDRSLTPTHGKLVIASIEGKLMVKRLAIKGNRIFLRGADATEKGIAVTEGQEPLHIWGIITHIIHKV